MSKSKRAREGHGSSEMEAAFQLWGKGNVLAARRASQRILEAEPTEVDRTEAVELLKATFPDQRTRLVAFGALFLLGLVLVVLKFLGA